MPKKAAKQAGEEKASAASGEENVSAEKASAKAAKSKRKKILIVEDEHPLAHALELKLSHEGYDTAVASTGSAGLKEASSGSYDLILLDLILPELDGFSILAELHTKKVKTPVIVLSNLGQDEDRKKAKELGVVEYLVKSNAPLADILSLVKKTV